MPKNIIRYCIHYFELRNLLKSWGYEEDAFRTAMKDIRAMERKSFNAFLHYVATGEYPKKPINEIDVKELVIVRKRTPAAAFLAASWMKTDPDKAIAIIGLPDPEEPGRVHKIARSEIPDDILAMVEAMEKAEASVLMDESDLITREE